MPPLDPRDVTAAQAGDLSAYGRVVTATEDMVLAVALRVVRRREDAEDAAQETYLRAYRRLGDLDDPRAFPGWLRSIAIHVASSVRRRRRAVFVPLEDAADLPALDESELRWTAEQRRALSSALVDLAPEDRRLCERRYTGGWSVARLAADARVTEGSMAKRLQRIRDRLRESIEDEERRDMGERASSGLPSKIVELLARPTLIDLPENPVAVVSAAIRGAFPGHELVELPEIVDLAEARAWLGSDPVYVDPSRLQRVGDERVLRYDLSLPMLMATRLDRSSSSVLRVATGKVYRREIVSSTHLEAFHQLEVLRAGEHSSLDAWAFAGTMLHAVDAALPMRTARLEPTSYPFCSRAWQIHVEVDGRLVEIMAFGQYTPEVVRALGGDPGRIAAMGAGFGLERIACLRFGIDDLRKVEDARVAAAG